MKNAFQTCNKTLKCLIAGVVLFFLISFNITQPQVRVEYDGAPFPSLENHQSWSNSTSDLQAAINNLSDEGGGTIWVAGDIYYPTELYSAADGSSATHPRSATFVIKSNVTIIGGFEGDETTPDERPENKFSNTNMVTLSDNIDQSDNNEGNSYHVVIYSEIQKKLGNITMIRHHDKYAHTPIHFRAKG